MYCRWLTTLLFDGNKKVPCMYCRNLRWPVDISTDDVAVTVLSGCVYRNSLRGSAVCAFKMDAIAASFEGPHKEQKTAHSNWLPVRQVDIPDPHPAKVCAL